MEWVRIQGTTGGHLLQSPCSSRGILEHKNWLSNWHRIASGWFFTISSEGDSTTSMGNLFSAWSPIQQSSSSCSGATLCILISAYFFLSYCSALLIKVCLHPPDTLPSNIHLPYIHPFTSSTHLHSSTSSGVCQTPM